MKELKELKKNLLQAVEQGDVETLKSLVNSSHALQGTVQKMLTGIFEHNRNALGFLANVTDVEFSISNLLLVDSSPKLRGAIIHQSVSSARSVSEEQIISVVAFLMHEQVDVGLRNFEDVTPAMLAANNGRFEVLKMLYSYNTSILVHEAQDIYDDKVHFQKFVNDKKCRVDFVFIMFCFVYRGGVCCIMH